MPNNLVFVDIETTGARSFYDRIIEIGMIRVEDGEIVKTFQTLINPLSHLPLEIIKLTGITPNQLENAPTFREVKQEILEMLIDCCFVAHNVRFDYGFLKSEFSRENITFTSRHFCTVRLSRLLFPEYSHHNLDSIIERFQIPCESRHRALDDARVIYTFYQSLSDKFSPEVLNEAIAKTLKKPSLPIKLKASDLDALPETPGIYIFYGTLPTFLNNEKKPEATSPNDIPQELKLVPLYVGKSKNIKDRVLSHFSQDISSPSEMKISQQIESIETIQTIGELGALLLETKMIKTLLPLYNKRSRIKRELVAVKLRVNKNGYNEYFLETVTTISTSDIESILGIFKSKKQAKLYLATLCQEFTLCEKLLGLEKTTTSCFGYRLNKCNGACLNLENPLLYNLRCVDAFTQTKIARWPFEGPIIIEEKTVGNRKEFFLIDKWCYIGSVTFDEEGNKKVSQVPSAFDLDVYQILRQYLKDPSKRRTIRPITMRELSAHLY